MKKILSEYRFFFYGMFLASLVKLSLSTFGVENIWIWTLTFLVLTPFILIFDKKFAQNQK